MGRIKENLGLFALEVGVTKKDLILRTIPFVKLMLEGDQKGPNSL